jgi:GntR family transcriptional repressor for pyruvate dehydrogenase complex
MTHAKPNEQVKTADQIGLTDQVTRYVIEHIRGFGLAPGEEVPSEVRTSAELKISRGVVREAYRSLRGAGILDISNGRPPRVGHLNNKAFLQIVEHGLTTQQVTVEHIIDLRSSIEIRSAELAAVNRTATHAKALEQKIDEFGKFQAEKWVETDIQFHVIIAEASGNPFFRLLSCALLQSMEVSIRVGLNRRTMPEQIDQMMETHKRLAQAIVAGDPENAGREMIVHFSEARAAILGRHDISSMK